jgi:adenylate kinase family enzyme
MLQKESRSELVIMPKRIHIIGSVGSGKTFLARFLSKQILIPYYQLDNMVWKRTPNGDVRNSDQERDRLLKEIISQESWIVEGAHHKWVSESFEKSDLIIYISPSKLSRDIRVFTRFLKQKFGLERGNYNQSIKVLFKHFKWNKEYDIIKKPEIFIMLKPHMSKVKVIRKNNEIINNLENWFLKNSK